MMVPQLVSCGQLRPLVPAFCLILEAVPFLMGPTVGPGEVLQPVSFLFG